MRTVQLRAAAVIAFLLAYCPHSLALNPSFDLTQYAHAAWTARDGLRGNVRSIVQTPDGYLWLGTEFGLTRFDGFHFVSWTPPGQRLPSSNIRSLLVARDGSLWIGTVEGLASWKQGTLTQYRDLAGQNVLTLAEDREGTVWAGAFGAPNGKLCAIQSAQVHCYGNDGTFRQWVQTLFEDSGGNLWAHTGAGLWRWKPAQQQFRLHLPGSFEASHTVAQNDDGTGLLAISDGRILEIVDGKISAYRQPGAQTAFPALNLLRDRDGALWSGTEGGGLVRMYRGKTSQFAQSDGLSGNRVLSLFEDRESNIWAGTANGLDCFREFTVSSISVKQGLSSPTIQTALVARDNSVWMSTNDGLNRWNDGRVTIYRTGGDRAQSTRFGAGHPFLPNPYRGAIETRVTETNDPELPDSEQVGSLFEDDVGRIWVSSPAGIARFEGGKFRRVQELPGGFVNAITGDGNTGLWIGYEDRGLVHLAGSKIVEVFPWPQLGGNGNASSMLADPKRGGLWLGFFQGGLVYFKDGQVRASLGKSDGLGPGRVMGLQLDHDGTVWAATEGGLSRIRNGRIATFNTASGFPCDAIHWAIGEDSDFWLYTPCGLLRVARAEVETAVPGRRIRFTLFDESNGVTSRALLTGYTPRVSKSADGKLWFAYFEGASIIDPRHLPVNTLPPPVHVEQIWADRKNVWQNWSGIAGSKLRLPKLTRDLEIDYTAASLVAPEKNRFKYMLEGYDRDWQDVGNRRQAFYTNLSPRQYRFRVIASNNSGLWNEAGDAIEFSLVPAYYQTNWFRALCVFAAMALMASAYGYRIWQVQTESRQLRNVIETIPAYVWSAEPDGSVDFVNGRWLKFTGFSLDQAVGWGWSNAVHPGDRDRLEQTWRTAISSGSPFEAEARMRRSDGQYRRLLVQGVPLRDRSGNIVKWYGKSLDIEDRERLRQLEADLAHTNRVSMMGELSASIAHEVNQPLAGIVSNGGACLRFLARDVPDMDEIRDAIRDIVRDGKRAGEVIARIRALTKRTSAPTEKLGLNETIQEVLAIVRDQAKMNGIVIRTEFSDELGAVSGDRVQLQQVLLNLIMNAIDAMKAVSDRPRQLAILTRNLQPGQVQVTVQDSGTGLDPDVMPRIFEAFYTTKPSGMGMGLSICRSILEHHGGRIWATANNGPGTSFHFTLPQCRDQHAGSGVV